MKKILGLDLGTTSIGWAYVLESDGWRENCEIKRLGVRVNPLTVDEQTNFEKGKSITTNAERTLKRSARRNLDRYQDRREALLETFKRLGIDTPNRSPRPVGFEIHKLRAKAATERIELEELAQVLLAINKKRGYKSSRKAKNEEEGEVIDGMKTAMHLYDNDLTPGQYSLQLLKNNKKYLPDYYRSDLIAEFKRTWQEQAKYYPEMLSDELLEEVIDKNKGATWKILEHPLQVNGITQKGSTKEKKLERYEWREKALAEKIDLEELVLVLQDINSQINGSSGYLGKISDRSKELHFKNETVGQFQYRMLQSNPDYSLKNKVFFRQDYLDEFERIWETQKQYHPELTDELKKEIRDITIFYQRRLKSQKGLISLCEFENKEITINKNGKAKKKKIGSKVAPKSSPLSQQFKIWQTLHNIKVTNKSTGEIYVFDEETKKMLFEELNIRGTLSKNQFLKLFVKKPSDWNVKFENIEGNRTNHVLYQVYQKIMEMEGHEVDFNKLGAYEINELLKDFLPSIGVDSGILDFDPLLDGKGFEKQSAYQLWHLLYSFEEDPNKKDHIQKLYAKLKELFGFNEEHARLLANVGFQEDYGSLSTKAIRKIFPFIKEHTYDKACGFAGYNHSASVTKEENERRILKERLSILQKNSLRNPVVEKILNQMVNVVNAVIDDPELGKPDEIRIELARDLKKSAKEREEMTSQINRAKKLHDGYRKELQEAPFFIKHPTRNDIIRYKLYLELKPLGFKTPYSQTYLPKEMLFSKDFDTEHIVPQSRLFDDSFSNKTLELRSINIEKGDDTAEDFILKKYGQKGLDEYHERIEMMLSDSDGISKAKYKKLMLTAGDIPEDFIQRDLRDSQYIAKKAKEMLLQVFRAVNTTSGSITDTLREDWGLVGIMKELNLDKFRKLGLTKEIEKKEGQKKEVIEGWSKRNDHRHHAMDALTVAFTTSSHVQYLNYLNARKDEGHKYHQNIIALEKTITYKDETKKRHFRLPMDNFREEAKEHLESILVSFKAKNKVMTRSMNRIKKKGGFEEQEGFTPRGQLHQETVYGKIHQYSTKSIKVGTAFDFEMIEKVAKPKFSDALKKRLDEHGGNPKKAFGGSNSPSKKPIYAEGHLQLPEKVKLVELEEQFTIRKKITPDLKVEKVIDVGARRALQKRLDEYNGNSKEAFSGLEENPIWLDRKKTKKLKRVKITGVNNAIPLHHKRDHLGKEIVDENGNSIPVDYVQLGNNHHIAIYEDEKGTLQEKPVSFFMAVERFRQGIPIVDKEPEEGWKFLYTLKQNEYFVFPSEGFDPADYDLLDDKNNSLISPHLFRVQKITSKDYFFRHHLETTVENTKETKGITWKREGLTGLKDIVKVRINHLGKIVQIGEY